MESSYPKEDCGESAAGITGSCEDTGAPLHPQRSTYLKNNQNMVRRPWLDVYFVYTSLAGSHTFFMIMLPMFAFFGHDSTSRALVIVLAAGVYLSSVLKDLFCAPRPFAPPVVRLSAFL